MNLTTEPRIDPIATGADAGAPSATARPPIKATLLALLQEHQREHPDIPISLTACARELGISRQYVFRLYDELAQDYALPSKYFLAYQRTLQDPIKQQVKELLAQGLSYPKTAAALGLPKSTVERFGRELRRSGEIASQAYSDELREDVRRLRQELLGTKEIARRLNISRRKATTILHRLIEAGEAPRLRKKRRTSAEVAALDAQVKKLREQGLTQNDIADKLNVDYSVVVSSTQRLLRSGATQPRTKIMTRADYRRFLTQVQPLLEQGLPKQRIADMLGVSRDSVAGAARNLRATSAPRHD